MSRIEDDSFDKYDIYYKSLKDFYNFDAPENISNRLNNVKKDIKVIKDQLFELSGKTANSADEIVTDSINNNDEWSIYTDDQLIPATKMIPDLQSLLDLRKKGFMPNRGNYSGQGAYDYNVEFSNYLRNQSNVSSNSMLMIERPTSIDELIDQKITQIKQKSGAYFNYGHIPLDPPQALYAAPTPRPMPEPLPQPLYAAPEPIPIPNPLIQPLYAVKPDPDIGIQQPLYAVKPDPDIGIQQPLYAVKPDPNKIVPIMQPEYGVDPDPKKIVPIMQPEYGVDPDPNRINPIKQPVYGVAPDPGRIKPIIQPEYGVDPDPNRISPIKQPVYGVAPDPDRIKPIKMPLYDGGSKDLPKGGDEFVNLYETDIIKK